MHRLKHAFFWILPLLIQSTVSAQSLPTVLNASELSIGTTITLHSEVLQEDRVLNIYLPLDYSPDNPKRYPVIYLLDGSLDEDFIHIAGIVQFSSFSWINRVPESIVVGIANVDRKRDFTYPSGNELDQKELPTSGKSADFITFLEKELQPFIDSTFATTSTKTIIGQSLGGLLATEILLKKPELFDNYVIVSPSLWWDDEKLLDAAYPNFISPKSVYIAVGKEGEVMERTAKELLDLLDANKPDHLQLFFQFLADKTHGDTLHIAAYNALGWIFE